MSWRPFVIVSMPRSGTHLLRASLESHPQILCQAEPFNSDDRRLPYGLDTPAREVLASFVYTGDHPPEITRVGFVLQAYHPYSLRAFPGVRENPRWDEVWDLLANQDDLLVIHLVRRNLLRRHLSHLVSRQTGQWHQWDPAQVDRVTHLVAPSQHEMKPRVGEPAAVEIDAELLRADFEDIERIRREARERLAGHPQFDVIYEELCDDYTRVCGEVQRFLGVEPLDLKPATKKLETRPLARAVSNFPQLAEAFRDTRWSDFF